MYVVHVIISCLTNLIINFFPELKLNCCKMSDSDSQPLIDSFSEEEGDQSDEEFLSDAGEEAKLGKQTSFLT